MALVALKCPSCGATVNFESEREFAFCTYCGTKVMQEKIIVEYRGSVKIEGTATDSSLLERANILLRDGKFGEADYCFDKVLNINPHCAEAYMGKLFCKIKARNESEFTAYPYSVANEDEFKHAIEYADKEQQNKYILLAQHTTKNQEKLCSDAYAKAKKIFRNRLIYGVLTALIFWFFIAVGSEQSTISTGLLTISLNCILLSLMSGRENKIIRLARTNTIFSIPAPRINKSTGKPFGKRERFMGYFSILLMDIAIVLVYIV